MLIDFLFNHPDKVKDVSEMVYKEFVLKSGSKMTFEDVVQHFSNTKTDTFPIALIALEDGECLGTVSVFENDLKIRETYKPWLASLFTKPEYRSRGVGQELTEKTKQVVKELGFKELYLRTETAFDYYRSRGWEFVETVSDDKYEKIDVFKINL